MGEYKKEGRVEEGWILFVKLQLALKVISRVIKCMNLIEPERFLIEGVEPQGKADENAKDKKKDLFSV